MPIQRVCHLMIGQQDSISYKVLGYGGNYYGQLGQNDYVDRSEWVEMYSAASGLYQIAIGSEHVVVLKSDGTLWGTGNNLEDALGLSGASTAKVPTQIGIDTDWAKVYAGYSQTFAIKENDTLWGCGYNGARQLGVGDTWPDIITQEITHSSNWKKVGIGWAHTIAVKKDGTLWGAGTAVALGLTGEVKVQFTQIGTATDWVDVLGGDAYSVAIKENGTIWSVGVNTNGELGLGHYNSPVANWTQEILGKTWGSFGYNSIHHSTFALDNDSKIWSTGLNNNYQLCLGDTTNRHTFTQVSTKENWTKGHTEIESSNLVDAEGSLWSDETTGLVKDTSISDNYFVMDYMRYQDSCRIMVVKV